MVERRTYPIEPLLEATGMTMSQLAQALGIGGPEYRRYRQDGMSRDVAERKALKAGFHPYEVWPEMVEDDLPMCDAEDCDQRYVPRPNQRFCSTRCARRVKQRRYRASHPEQQEKDRERARRYHAETPQYQRLRKAQWRQRQGREPVDEKPAVHTAIHMQSPKKSDPVLWHSTGGKADGIDMSFTRVIRGADG